MSDNPHKRVPGPRIYSCPTCYQSFRFAELSGPRVPDHREDGRRLCSGSGEVPIRKPVLEDADE